MTSGRICTPMPCGQVARPFFQGIGEHMTNELTDLATSAINFKVVAPPGRDFMVWMFLSVFKKMNLAPPLQFLLFRDGFTSGCSCPFITMSHCVHAHSSIKHICAKKKDPSSTGRSARRHNRLVAFSLCLHDDGSLVHHLSVCPYHSTARVLWAHSCGVDVVEHVCSHLERPRW